MRKLVFLIAVFVSAVNTVFGVHPGAPGRDGRRTVVLTFDDATASHREFVAPLLKKYGFGATFYICEYPGFENKEHYMTWEQVRELSNMGFEIGNHTRDHRSMKRLTRAEIDEEIVYIEEKCREYAIPHPVTFAYPGYGTSPDGIELLREKGYKYARHGNDKPYIAGVSDPMLLPSYAIHEKDDRTLAFLQEIMMKAEEGQAIVLCFHGVPDLAHDFVSTSPKAFKAILKYLKKNGCRVIALKDL